MWDGLGEKTFVGMGNYERLLGLGDQKMDRKFETSFWNNIKWLLLISTSNTTGFVYCIIPEPDCDWHPSI